MYKLAATSCMLARAGSVVLVGLLLTSRARAADPPMETRTESEEDRRAAARSFAEGEKAFKAREYARAAAAFDAAYARAPRPAALWNSARAWHRARELERAANLYAKYLRLAPADAPDRAAAEAALRELAPSLGQLEIHASGFDSVSVDGRPIEGRDSEGSFRWYVVPGSHVVSGTADGRRSTQTPDVAAGVATSVVLRDSNQAAPEGAPATGPSAAPPAQPSAPPVATPTPVPLPAQDRAATGGGQSTLGWVVLGVGGVGLGVGAVSGLLAKSKKSDLEGQCLGGDLDRCPTSAKSDVESYNRLLDVSSVGFILGGIAVAGGAVLLLSAPSSPDRVRSARVTPFIGVGSVGMRGAF